VNHPGERQPQRQLQQQMTLLPDLLQCLSRP
jgi:hypothetical protein